MSWSIRCSVIRYWHIQHQMIITNLIVSWMNCMLGSSNCFLFHTWLCFMSLRDQNIHIGIPPSARASAMRHCCTVAYSPSRFSKMWLFLVLVIFTTKLKSLLIGTTKEYGEYLFFLFAPQSLSKMTFLSLHENFLPPPPSIPSGKSGAESSLLYLIE